MQGKERWVSKVVWVRSILICRPIPACVRTWYDLWKRELSLEMATNRRRLAWSCHLWTALVPEVQIVPIELLLGPEYRDTPVVWNLAHPTGGPYDLPIHSTASCCWHHYHCHDDFAKKNNPSKVLVPCGLQIWMKSN